MVSSRNWPLISRYRVAVRTQSARVEMIALLFKPVLDKDDDGIIRLAPLATYICSETFIYVHPFFCYWIMKSSAPFNLCALFRELLRDFYATSNGRKPYQIVILRCSITNIFNVVLALEL